MANQRVDAYVDNGHISDATVVESICKALGTTPADFGLVPLYQGGGQHGIARECRKCGGGLGSLDPHEVRWVILGICPDCDEG